ncbi:MAG TPA: response regulator transcription factor [Candidatus Acidoferrales bacterium]|nr:response regulator transcription factor [Candidatus Acidoferrales bacterium]
MIRVFIVAASPLARAGLQKLLAAHDVEITGHSGSVNVLADQLPDAAPDVILIDSTGEPFKSMLDSVITSGLASDSSVVLLGDGISGEASADALRAGIRAVLPNDISTDQLAAALHAAASGLMVLHRTQANEAFPAGSNSTHVTDEFAESLTPRELEVLQMLAAGLSNKEVAARLNISEHTAKFHVASILGKLGAGSRTEAVSLGIRRGLVLL